MTTSPYIADVGRENFDTLVIEKSREVPVLVDFWASWCGPCRMLMPLLAKLAEEYRGKFFLAKVNTDAEQELAARYDVRSIPTVRLFRDGQAVDGFIGVQPEGAIRALLDRYIVRESDLMAREALAALEAGRTEEAVAKLEQAAASDPTNHRVTVALARALIEAGRLEQAEQAIHALPIDRRQDPEVTRLASRLELARALAGAPSAAELEKRLAANPDDLEARFLLGLAELVAGRYEAGLERLLDVVRRDRKFRDDAARKAMVAAFNLLGHSHPTTVRYRGLLASALN
jgi:putative thioredoxin